VRSLYVASPECCAEGGASRFYALHRRYRPGGYETWKYIAPVQKAAWSHKTFEYGTWGGEIRREFEPQPGEIVAPRALGLQWFANTDLNLQLERHGIHQLIVMGLIAHSYLEATVRHAAEFGYEVTMVKERPRITQMRRCTPLSMSISRTTVVSPIC
jgi:nicotinamidase-related amidase